MQIERIIHILSTLGLLVGLVTMPIVGQAAIVGGSINGTVTYSGDQDPNHEILVAAHLSLEDEPVASIHIFGPGEYTLADLPDGSYYISAFLDLNDSGGGPPDTGEPEGWYDANGDEVPDTVTVSGDDITGIDITLSGGENPGDNAIEGTACYLGGVYGPGPLTVNLHDDTNAAPLTSQEVTLPCGDYAFEEGPTGTYYISLFYDVDDSGEEPAPGEPFGWYDVDGDGNPDPLIYSGTVITDVNITLGTVHYVDFSATGADDGTSWEDAFTDLQEALSAVSTGEEIWVAAGIYTPGDDREASFVLQDGVAVYGGFNGTETHRVERNWRTNSTVLSGEIGNPGTKADNVYHVVTTTSTYQDPIDQSAILDGFTISGGYANGGGVDQDKGGGFLNNFGHPTLVNLNFVGNYSDNHGGALANQYSSTPLVVINSTFSGNSTMYNGGAMVNLNSAHILVVNSSFTENTGANGGGIVNVLGSFAQVHNTIFWGNQGTEIANQDTSTSEVTYSLIEGGYTGGTQILTGDPQFVNPAGLDNTYGTLDDDLHLGTDSPAIDAGDNNQLQTDLADSDGDANTSETNPLDLDSGERRVDEPIVSDTGNGTPPLVDMGADEYAPAVAISGLSAVAGTPLQAGTPSVLAARVTGGSHIDYQWNFGDGSSAGGGATEHIYTTAGVYQVVVTATNSLGCQQTSLTVSVEEDLSVSPGGMQTTADGALTFEVPASATGAVTITYTPLITTTQSLGDFQFAGLSFQLSASDESGDPIIEPGETFTLTLVYDESALPESLDENSLELYRYDEGSASWVALAVIDRNLDNDTLTVSLDHFSEFALLASEPQNTLYLPLVIR